MLVKERKAFAAEAKKLALKDAHKWLDEQVAELHAREKDVHAFHQWWHHLLRWGRKLTRGINGSVYLRQAILGRFSGKVQRSERHPHLRAR